MAAPGTNSAATEHTDDLQLIELVNPEAGMSFEMDLKVIRNEIVNYTYSWQSSAYTEATSCFTIENSRAVLLGCCKIAKERPKRTQADCKSVADWHDMEDQQRYASEGEVSLYSHSMSHCY